MTIHASCRCGTELATDVAYAGGRIKCPACGDMVVVPSLESEISERIRFSCPHCSTRVMARIRSAGKPSKCPACGETYLIPEQANVPILSTHRVKSRIELIDAADAPPVAVSKSLPAPVHPNEAFATPPLELEIPKSLSVIGGGLDGEVVRLWNNRMLVGRERDCHFQPKSQLISRHHCVFLRDEFTLRVRDLGSHAGTFVNGQRILGEFILHPGDTIVMGDVTLRVSPSSPAAPFGGRFTVDSDPSINDFIVH